MDISPETIGIVLGAGGLGALLTYLGKSREAKNQYDLTRTGLETAKETTVLDRYQRNIDQLSKDLRECGEHRLELTADKAALLEYKVASGIERLRMEAENAALIKREKSLERIADRRDPAGLVARFEIDAKGIIVDWSLAAEEMFGMAQAEVIGQSVEILYPYETREEHSTALKTAMEGKGPPLIGGPPRVFDTVVLNKFGEEILATAEWRTYLRDGAQRFAGIFRFREKDATP